MSSLSTGSSHPGVVSRREVDTSKSKRSRMGSSRGFSIARAIFFSLLVFDLSILVSTYRISAAPDIFTDEIIYSRAAVRVAGEGALVWDTGDPFLVHPPLYFIAAGVFHYLTGDPATPLFAAGNIFNTVFHMRILNCIFGALTAVVLYWFGRQIMGDWLGLFYAALFLLDPFALRINRRAMLETMAVLMGTTALLVYFYDLRRLSHRLVRMLISPWTLVAGLFMGAALLTKELAFVYLLVPALFALWELWRQQISVLIGFGKRQPTPEYGSDPGWIVPVRSGVVIATALLLYAIYPVWVASFGYIDKYLAEKSLGMLRLFGLVQITGWNRPGISFFELLVERLTQYGTSYLLLAAGGLALLAILVWGRGSLAGRLLASIGLVFYPIFSFIAIFGSGNDQFFYFLFTPAILLVGYALIALPPQLSFWPFTLLKTSRVAVPADTPVLEDTPTQPIPVGGALDRSASVQSRSFESPPTDGISPDTVPGISKPVGSTSTGGEKTRYSAYAALTVGLFLVLIFTFNIWRWWSNYVVTSDNAYTQFTTFVEENLQPGEPINASGDPIKFRYFLPNHPISFAANPDEAMQTNTHYYALAPKDVIMHYGRIQPELAAWIQKNGTPIFRTTGTSYGDIYLYQVSAVPASPSMMIITGKHAAQGTRFDIAKGGAVWTLVLVLVLVGLAFMCLFAWLIKIENSRSHSELSVYLSTLLGGSRSGSHPSQELAQGKSNKDIPPKDRPNSPDKPATIHTDRQGDLGD